MGLGRRSVLPRDQQRGSHLPLEARPQLRPIRGRVLRRPRPPLPPPARLREIAPGLAKAPAGQGGCMGPHHHPDGHVLAAGGRVNAGPRSRCRLAGFCMFFVCRGDASAAADEKLAEGP